MTVRTQRVEVWGGCELSGCPITMVETPPTAGKVA